MGLENSISEMIERQDSLSDKADAAEARHEAYMGKTTPSLQPIIGLLPNQCGTDSNGDGLPDGWVLPTNDGFTSWSLVGASTTGSAATEIPVGGIEEEFYDNIPLSSPPGFRNFQFNFWRMSWDFTAGSEPASIAVFNTSDIPFLGQAALWIKEEVPGILDHRVWNKGTSRIVRGTNDWAIWSSRNAPFTKFANPGNYHHARLDFDTTQIPNVGSVIICGPQAIPCYVPVDVVGWDFLPGLNRYNDNGDYTHRLLNKTQAWETK